MQRFLWLILLAISCKQLSELKSSPVPLEETLFDKLIAASPDGKIPYPFTKLVSYLSQYGTPIGVLVPLGRSLQRHESSFQDPRRLVGFSDLDSSSGIAEFSLSGRLFLSYVEKTKLIEVMSLLPGKEKFDFQLIENYGEENQITKFPNQATCMSCHQHGGPIFTPFPWSETNFSDFVSLLLKRRHPDGHVDGIPIEQPEVVVSKNPEIRLFLSEVFEGLVTEAADILFDQKIWRGCPNIKCREDVLRRTFSLVNLAVSKPAKDSLVGVEGLAREIIPDSMALGGLLPSVLEKFASRVSKNNAERYVFSDAAKAVFTKIVTEKAGVPFDKIGKKEEIQLIIISFFLEVGAVATKNVFSDFLEKFPSLPAKDLNVIYDEVEKLISYIHKHDLHLDSDLDPLVEREHMFERSNPYFLGTILKIDINAIFIQQTLLPANKNLQGILNQIDFELDTSSNSTSIINFYGDTSSRSAFDVRGVCQTAQEVSCEFKAFATDPDFADNVELISEEPLIISVDNFNFHSSRKSEERPAKTSKLIFKANGKEYQAELLCRKKSFALEGEHDMYVCTTYDPWQINAAITKLAADSQGALTQSILYPVAIIKGILANLGYDLKTHSGVIDWRKNYRLDLRRAKYSQLSPKVKRELLKNKTGSILVKHCAGCHDTKHITPSFLVSTSMEELCQNINANRAVIIEQVKAGLMPPVSSEQNKGFTTKRAEFSVDLEMNKFPFCSP